MYKRKAWLAIYKPNMVTLRCPGGSALFPQAFLVAKQPYDADLVLPRCTDPAGCTNAVGHLQVLLLPIAHVEPRSPKLIMLLL